MIILVEGAEGVGKSRFAKQLGDDTGFAVVDGGLPFGSPLGHFGIKLDAAQMNHEHFIFDGFHISYYGNPKGKPEWFERHLETMDMVLARLNPWLFLLVDDPFAVEARGCLKTLTREQFADVQARCMTAYNNSKIENRATFQYSQFWDGEKFTRQYGELVNRIRREAGLPEVSL
jgi:hypothetical protein